MIPVPFKLKCVLALFIGGVLTANIALADKPEWAGGGNKGGKGKHSEERADKGGKGHDDNRHEGRNDNDASGRQRGHFEERHAAIVRDYYGEQMRGGHCPPGLAKKHNGCMPPGQAKKWQVGHRLPPEVIYYPVPQPLVVQIGPPPSGYRYVRVASDILMIAIGSGMVVDAIKDLGRS
jgi:Ni/Co efflux regulator RcnB